MPFLNTHLSQTSIFHIVLSCSASVLLTACGGEGDADTSTTENVVASSSKSSSKTVKTRANGLICKQPIGNFSRTTWIGNINYEGRSVMATRSAMDVKSGVSTLIHDSGQSVTSYILQEGATERPPGIVADTASFDGNVQEYLSSMKYVFGQCSDWTVDPDFLSPVLVSSEPSARITPKNNVLSKADSKPDKIGQNYLNTLLASNVVRCGVELTFQDKVRKQRTSWADEERPYLFVKHIGKNTPDLSDDALHSKQRFYVTNAADRVSQGDKAAYVSITQHVLFNEKGRYQWVENADETMTKIKAMGSLEKGKSIAKLEKHFTPIFIENRILRYQMRDEERANFVYSFGVWNENIKAADYPVKRVKKCEIPKSAKMPKPPKLDYLTYDKVWERYINRDGAELDRRKASGREFTDYVNLTRFPFKIDRTGLPKFAPKNLSKVTSK